MSVICRRELTETKVKSTVHLRKCSGISEIVDRWTNSTVRSVGNTHLSSRIDGDRGEINGAIAQLLRNK